jgi:hypothetical protein
VHGLARLAIDGQLRGPEGELDIDAITRFALDRIRTGIRAERTS